jgi:hypothetical protein
MTSVQSAIAQVPRYSKTLVALASTASYTAVKTTPSSSGALLSQVGSSYNFNTSAAITAANVLTAGATIASGTQLRDLGGKLHVFSNGELALTLSLVQVLDNMATEGVTGSYAGSVPTDFTTAYVVTFSAQTVTATTVPVTVARVGGY